MKKKYLERKIETLLYAMEKGSVTAKDLMKDFGLSQSAASETLRRLYKQRLLERKRVGTKGNPWIRRFEYELSRKAINYLKLKGFNVKHL
jgi:DNA-binding transcriptional ArsR family regulator